MRRLFLAFLLISLPLLARGQATGFRIGGVSVGIVGQPTSLYIAPTGGSTGQSYSVAITSSDGTGTATTPVTVPSGTTTSGQIPFTFTPVHDGPAVTLTATATPALGTPGTAEFITVRQTHPRIWWTATRLARWQGYRDRNTSRWVTLKATADAILNSGLAASTYFYSDLIPLAAAYQVSGNPAYADRCIAILTQSTDCCATPPQNNWWTRDSYFDMRDHLPAIACAYDWCFARMSTAQKQQVATLLMDRADATWADTNPSRSGDFGMFDPSSNYFVGFCMTWPAALAIYGDGTDTTATGTVSSPNRAAYHIWLGRTSKYRSYMRPYEDGWGAGGTYIGAEGTNYDSTQRKALILDAHNTATGEDLLNGDSATWTNDSLLFRIYATTPDLSKNWIWGSQPNSSLSNLNYYARQREMFLAALTSNLTYAGQGKYWLNAISIANSGGGEPGAWEFLYWLEDTELTAVSTSTLPLYYYASGPGILVKQSSWTSTASKWTIQCGQLRNNHQLRDENGFRLWRGGYLLGSAQDLSQNGTLEDTISQNNWTIGEQQYNGQFPDNSNQAGSVLGWQVSSDFAFFKGQAAGPYDYSFSSGQLDTYISEWVAMNGDTLLFKHDYLVSRNAANHKRLILQSARAFTLTTPGWTTNNGTYRVDGRVLIPADVVLGASSWNYGLNGALSSYFMNIRPGFARAVDTMLLVMQTAAVGAGAQPTPVLVTSSDGKLEGGWVGSYLALFGSNDVQVDAAQPGHSYTFTAGPTQHLVCDLAPSQAYTVVASPSGNTQSVTTSSAGVLRFTVPSGTTGVTLSTGNATGFTLSGPASGQPGVDQTYTIIINGPASTNYTFTLDDGGGGGTFTGSPSYPAGGTGAQTFRYRNSTPGAYTITATPSPGLGIPPFVTYTVLSPPAPPLRRGRHR